MTLAQRLETLLPIAQITAVTLLLTLAAHLVSQPETLSALLPGHLVLFSLVMAGFLLAKLIPTSLPDLFWVSLLACLSGMPFTPGSEWVLKHISQLSLTPSITPVLACAALGLQADDIKRFRKIGLQVIVISLLVFTGTYFGSAFVAQGVLFFGAS